MMRGTYNWSVAVREPSGSVYVEEHDLASGRKKNTWMYWPGVRGCRALVAVSYTHLDVYKRQIPQQLCDEVRFAAIEVGAGMGRD